MKGIRNTLRLAVAAAGLIAPLLLLASRLSGGGESLAQAQGPITIGFDMNTAGNTCPGDGVTDCTLGPIDACVELPSGGGAVTIDVFVKDLPPTSGDGWIGGIVGFAYTVGETMGRAVGTLTAWTHDDPATNLLVQEMPRGSSGDFSHPPAPPAPLPGWFAFFFNYGEVEYDPPFTRGVLSRLQIDTTGTADGVYGLTLGPVPGEGSYVEVTSSGGNSYCDPATPAYVGCDILDTYDDCGLIAIGQPCPGGLNRPCAPPAVGGVARLADVSGSSGPNRTALAGLAAAGLLAFAAGAWYAKRRWLRRA